MQAKFVHPYQPKFSSKTWQCGAQFLTIMSLWSPQEMLCALNMYHTEYCHTGTGWPVQEVTNTGKCCLWNCNNYALLHKKQYAVTNSKKVLWKYEINCKRIEIFLPYIPSDDNLSRVTAVKSQAFFLQYYWVLCCQFGYQIIVMYIYELQRLCQQNDWVRAGWLPWKLPIIQCKESIFHVTTYRIALITTQLPISLTV